MIGIAAQLLRSRAASFIAITATAAVLGLMLSAQSSELASANSPTIPKPNNVRWEPGNAAKKLVLSWDAAPSVPSGCTYRKTSLSVGNPTTNQYEDEEDIENNRAYSATRSKFGVFNDQGHWANHDFRGGTTYRANVILYATCSGSLQQSATVRIDAKAPYSGPATGFSATTGTASGAINLSWTNPTLANGVTVTKREYRAKLSSASSWPSSWTQAGSATSYTITGLNAGANYDIQFRVQTNSVPTKTLAASSVRANGVVVGSVGSPSATSGTANGAVNLAWSAASSATSYEYQSKKSTASGWGAWTSAGTGTSTTITGLDQGAIYQFRLRGKASTVTGVPSSTVSAVAQFTPTASATAGSAAQTVAVSVTAQQGLTVTRYEIRWKLASAGSYPSSGAGSWTSLGSNTSSTITGLTGSTAYHVQVRVFHTSGDPASSTSLLKTISVASSAAVKPPTNFAAVAGSQFGSVNLSWTAPTGQTVTRYEFRSRESGGSYSATWTSAGTNTSHTVTGLKTDDTGYDFELRTVASGGNSGAVSLTTIKPKQLPAPTDPAANSGSAKGTIVLTWTGVSGFTPARYEYRWKLTSTNAWPASGATGDWTPAGTSSTRATASSATISGLTANTSYDFQLRTVEGTMPNYSAPVSVTATSRAVGAPTGFAASQGTIPGVISISWTDPTGATITARQYRTKASGQTTVFQGAWQSAGVTSPFAITGFDAGTDHDIQFRVSANGGHSVSVTATATAGTVPPPTNVQAFQGSNPGEIDITWTAPSGITVTAYWYRSKQASASAYPTNWESVSAASTSKTLTGLIGNVEHNIQLRAAIRISGRASDSYSLPVTVSAIAKPIPPPTDPDVEETPTPGIIRLQWVPPDEVETHGFQVRYKPQNGEEGTWSQWIAVNGHQTSTQVDGLQVGVGYQFELTAENGPLGMSPPIQFAMEPSPAVPPTGLMATGGVRLISLVWDTPAEGIATGYRYRYREASDAEEWSDWLSVELADTETQTTFIYGLRQATSYAVELTAQRGNTFSEAVAATAMTNLDIPAVGRISPVTPSVSVVANSRIVLEVDVYDTQNWKVNEDVDGQLRMFKGINAFYEWSETPAAGSFAEPGNSRRVVYNAPASPGTYTINAVIAPRGICTSHYRPVEGADPCQATFTVRVSADLESNGRRPAPSNPPGPIPTSLHDTEGNTYTVFTPEQGGSIQSEGVELSANAGAVPDNTIVGVRIAAVNDIGAAPNGLLDLADTGYRVVGINAQSAPVTGLRFDDPVPICLPVPTAFTSRLSDVSIAELESDGSVKPIGQRLAPSTGGTVVCATVNELPSTFVVVARQSEQPAPSEVEVSVDTGNEADAQLPDAGGFAPNPMLLALIALLAALIGGIMATVGSSSRLNGHRSHRSAHR